MEKMAGMLENPRLSEEERKGMKIMRAEKGKGKQVEIRAIGKVMAERLAHPDAICNSLGRIWSPIHGVDCKDLGENKFMFIFKQEREKRKALEDGPWMFDNALVVMEEFIPSKRIDDYEFKEIPIWIRVYGLPLGDMDEDTGEMIENMVGDFVEVDTRADGRAIGKYLRVKVRLQIGKPLMRGFKLDTEQEDGASEEEENQRRVEKETNRSKEEDEKEEEQWCRFEYEYLPDFCYICGRLGHVDRECLIKLKRAQFGRWMKADMGTKRSGGQEGAWRSSSRGNSDSRVYDFGRHSDRSGSDSLSWRKDGSRSVGGGGAVEKGPEVTSPSKGLVKRGKDGNPRKISFMDKTTEPHWDEAAPSSMVIKEKGEAGVDEGGMEVDGGGTMEQAGRNGKVEQEAGAAGLKGGKGGKEREPGTFKEIGRREEGLCLKRELGVVGRDCMRRRRRWMRREGRRRRKGETRHICVKKTRSYRTTIHRPGCKSSLAGSHENNKLELPGTWEWPDSSCTPRSLEEGGSRHSFSGRN